HENIDIRGRDDLVKMDRKPVRKGKVLSRGQGRSDVIAKNARSQFIGHKDHDDVSDLGRVTCIKNFKSGRLCLCPRPTLFRKTDDDLASRVAKIIRMRM